MNQDWHGDPWIRHSSRDPGRSQFGQSIGPERWASLALVEPPLGVQWGLGRLRAKPDPREGCEDIRHRRECVLSLLFPLICQHPLHSPHPSGPRQAPPMPRQSSCPALHQYPHTGQFRSSVTSLASSRARAPPYPS